MKVKVKQKGSMLIAAIITTILYIFISSSFVVIATGGAGMIGASRVALQAQQYAEIDVDILKNIDYEELDTHGVKPRQAMTNISEPDWEHEITIAGEAPIAGSDTKQRIATIHIYKKGDTLPRFTLEVPLTSQGSGDNLPIGTILAYVGDFGKIPRGWAVCDGTGGTPDLRDKFLEGSGTFNVKSSIGAGLPNIMGEVYEGECLDKRAAGCFQKRIISKGPRNYRVAGDGDGDVLITFSASRSSAIYGRSSTVQPSAYIVYFIIKVY